jgi:hypothetical protein
VNACRPGRYLVPAERCEHQGRRSWVILTQTHKRPISQFILAANSTVFRPLPAFGPGPDVDAGGLRGILFIAYVFLSRGTFRFGGSVVPSGGAFHFGLASCCEVAANHQQPTYALDKRPGSVCNAIVVLRRPSTTGPNEFHARAARLQHHLSG